MHTATLSRRYIVVLALASGLVLAAGSLLRPREAPKPPVSETESLQLQRLAERSRLERSAGFFTEWARGLGSHLAYDPARQTSGVYWKSADRLLVPTEQGLLQLASAPKAEPNAAPVPLANAPARVGDWVLLAAQNQDDSLASVPALVTALRPCTCGGESLPSLSLSVPLTAAFDGGGIFNLGSRLVGVILPCGDGRRVAVPPSVIDGLVARADSLPFRLWHMLGLRVEQDASAAALLVTEVRHNASAARAGLLPGDRIVSIAGEPVTSPESLRPALADSSGDPIPLEIQRNSRPLRLALGESDSEVDALSGASLAESPSGLLLSTVTPSSRAAQVGLRSGDRILRVGAKPDPRRSDLARALSPSAPPTFLVIDRDGVLKGVRVGQ